MSDYKKFALLGFIVGVAVVIFIAFLVSRTYATYNHVQIPKLWVCHCVNENNCNSLHLPIPAVAAHLRQHDDDYAGVCQEVEEEEPKDYCDTLEGVQGEDVNCPREEPTPTEEPKPHNPPTFAGSSTNPPGTCSDPKPSQVANINVVTNAGESGVLVVQWALPLGADRVHIQYGLTQSGNEHSLLNTPNDGNEPIRELKSNEHYWFRVSGVNGCAVGDYSNWFDPLVP